MINYKEQIRHLSEAQGSIQSAISESTQDLSKGKMYATMDLITAQIDSLLFLDQLQSNEETLKTKELWESTPEEVSEQ